MLKILLQFLNSRDFSGFSSYVVFFNRCGSRNAGLTSVNVGLTELANKRFYTRLKEVRDAMNARLGEVDESKIDRHWFESEEGQTLLFEAIRQAVATSDRDKIKMLGTALANGRVTDFSSEERKELFLQLIRDLSPQHIVMLRRLMPDQASAWRPKIEGKGQDLLVLQMLYASGLVTESLKHNKAQASLQRYGSGTLSPSRQEPDGHEDEKGVLLKTPPSLLLLCPISAQIFARRRGWLPKAYQVVVGTDSWRLKPELFLENGSERLQRALWRAIPQLADDRSHPFPRQQKSSSVNLLSPRATPRNRVELLLRLLHDRTVNKGGAHAACAVAVPH